MAKGGKRAGAGRKKGAASIKTREIAVKLAAEGTTPLEVILKDMRELDSKADVETDNEKRRTLRRAAREAAKDAAPYIHAKLQPVDGSGSTDQVLNVTIQRHGDTSSKKELVKGHNGHHPSERLEAARIPE